jgi:hypothetical protein
MSSSWETKYNEVLRQLEMTNVILAERDLQIAKGVVSMSDLKISFENTLKTSLVATMSKHIDLVSLPTMSRTGALVCTCKRFVCVDVSSLVLFFIDLPLFSLSLSCVCVCVLRCLKCFGQPASSP